MCGIKHKEGICPNCGAELNNWSDSAIESNSCYYEWSCDKCGTSGEEWYDLVFSEHKYESDINRVIGYVERETVARVRKTMELPGSHIPLELSSTVHDPLYSRLLLFNDGYRMHIRYLINKEDEHCIETRLFNNEGMDVAVRRSNRDILGEHELCDKDGRKYIIFIETINE